MFKNIPGVRIEYVLCLNDYLKSKTKSNIRKYKVFMELMEKYGIDILYGQDSDYYDKLNHLIELTCNK